MLGPWKIDEGFWVAVVGFSVAAACAIIAMVFAYRESKRTGREPAAGGNGLGWFGALAFLLVLPRSYVPDAAMRSFPLCVLYPSLDLAFLVGFAAVGVWAMSWVFRPAWHWRHGLWIALQLLWPAVFVFFVISDLRDFRGMPWVWIPAGFIAFFGAPFFARFAYQDLLARGQSEPSSDPQPDFRLWRPGDPR